MGHPQNLAAFTVVQLKAALRERGAKVSGLKSSLIERLDRLLQAEDPVSTDTSAALSEALPTMEATPSPAYLGVTWDTDAVMKQYRMDFTIVDRVISEMHWTALDAARAYDDLVRLYGDARATNFDVDDALFANTHLMPTAETLSEEDNTAASHASPRKDVWTHPSTLSVRHHSDIIPVRKGAYLTVDEVMTALAHEKGINVTSIALAGKSQLCDHMVFCTGRSAGHLRKMADLLCAAIRARKIKDQFDYAVEGRDCDDWMIVDLNTIIVQFLGADMRERLQLEAHWSQMENDTHAGYGHMDEEQYVATFGEAPMVDPNDDGKNVDELGMTEEEAALASKDWE